MWFPECSPPPPCVRVSVVRHCSLTLFTFQTSFLTYHFGSLIVYSFYASRLCYLKQRFYSLNSKRYICIYIFMSNKKTLNLKKKSEPSASAAMTTVPRVKGSFTPVPRFTGLSSCVWVACYWREKSGIWDPMRRKVGEKVFSTQGESPSWTFITLSSFQKLNHFKQCL